MKAPTTAATTPAATPAQELAALIAARQPLAAAIRHHRVKDETELPADVKKQLGVQ